MHTHILEYWKITVTINSIRTLRRLIFNSATTMTTSMTLLPISQTAIVQDSAGQPVISHNVPIPQLQLNTLLIKTAAVAVNQCDHKMGTNFPAPGAIIGSDFVGKIVRMDPSVTTVRPDLKPGDTVCGYIHGSNPAEPGSGAFAEYLLAHAQLVYKVPESMKPLEAAAIGVGLLTAALSFWKAMGLPSSPEKPLSSESQPIYVLIYGASTASGTMALQLLQL